MFIDMLNPTSKLLINICLLLILNWHKTHLHLSSGTILKFKRGKKLAPFVNPIIALNDPNLTLGFASRGRPGTDVGQVRHVEFTVTPRIDKSSNVGIAGKSNACD